MALRATDLMLAMQDRVPFYSPGLVPLSTTLRLLSTAERGVCRAAHRTRPRYLSQELQIYLRRVADNAVGAAGAGVGAFARDDAGGLAYGGVTGAVSGFDLSAPLIAPVVVTGVAGTTLTVLGSPFTANQWDGQLAVIVAGPGTGPTGTALITTTSTGSLLLAAAIPGVVAGKSVLGIFAPNATVSPTDRAVVNATMQRTVSAYLTKLDATGTAYLDLADPLIANATVGVPLPPMGLALKLEAWKKGDLRAADLQWVEPALRGSNIRGPVWTIDGGKLYLLGESSVWDDFQNLVLVYQPIPPELTSPSQVLLMPEPARDAVASDFAVMIAMRVLRITPAVDSGGVLGGLQSDAATELQDFLSQIQGAGAARRRQTTERF